MLALAKPVCGDAGRETRRVVFVFLRKKKKRKTQVFSETQPAVCANWWPILSEMPSVHAVQGSACQPVPTGTALSTYCRSQATSAQWKCDMPLMALCRQLKLSTGGKRSAHDSLSFSLMQSQDWVQLLFWLKIKRRKSACLKKGAFDWKTNVTYALRCCHSLSLTWIEPLCHYYFYSVVYLNATVTLVICWLLQGGLIECQQDNKNIYPLCKPPLTTIIMEWRLHFKIHSENISQPTSRPLCTLLKSKEENIQKCVQQAISIFVLY